MALRQAAAGRDHKGRTACSHPTSAPCRAVYGRVETANSSPAVHGPAGQNQNYCQLFRYEPAMRFGSPAEAKSQENINTVRNMALLRREATVPASDTRMTGVTHLSLAAWVPQITQDVDDNAESEPEFSFSKNRREYWYPMGKNNENPECADAAAAVNRDAAGHIRPASITFHTPVRSRMN